MNPLHDRTPAHPDETVRPGRFDWLWFTLLVVSLLTGFGMTLFAPV